MDKELLKKMKARQEQRLEELRGKIESGELREADIDGVQQEIDAVIEELNGIKDALEDDGDAGDGKDGGVGNGTDDPDNRSGDEPSGDGVVEGGDGEDDPENRSGMISQEQLDGLLDSIKSGLEARSKMTKTQKDQQLRKAFANFVIGNISEAEARALGIETGNGSVTVPEVIASEVITYEKSVKETGEYSDQSQKLYKRLLESETGENKLRSALEQTNDALKEQGNVCVHHRYSRRWDGERQCFYNRR